MSCNSSVAWKGILKVNGNSLPFLSGDISNVTEVFQPQLIGWSNDAADRSPYNYALSKKYVQGTISSEVFSSGPYATSFTDLVKAAVKGTQVQLDFSPSGGTSFSLPDVGKCYVSSMELHGNNQGLVTGSFGIISSDADIDSGGTSSLQDEPVQDTDDSNPVPWYYSSFHISSSSSISNNITEWSISMNNNPDMIFGLDGDTGVAPVDIRLGTFGITGSFNYYNSSGSYPELVNGTTGTLDIGPITLKFPYLVFNNGGVPNQGGDSLVVAVVSFIGFGDSDNPAIYIS